MMSSSMLLAVKVVRNKVNWYILKLELRGSSGELDGGKREKKDSKMTARFLNWFSRRLKLPLTEKIKAVEGTSFWEFDFTYLEFEIQVEKSSK